MKNIIVIGEERGNFSMLDADLWKATRLQYLSAWETLALARRFSRWSRQLKAAAKRKLAERN